ncbi:BnaCnng19810D [Brassica napus]|uniref:BnaCnng19810D protein n=1 Tax=Brassica napus TaxID=3708 RepID=A0A078IN93_BRANA|nr:BnaCnng19810D [Brassica napus]
MVRDRFSRTRLH